MNSESLRHRIESLSPHLRALLASRLDKLLDSGGNGNSSFETGANQEQRRGNSPQILAYVVPKKGENPTNSELYELLREELPDYMLPATFMQLNTLPRSPNGKVDRRALPPPEEILFYSDDDFVEPRNEAERKLAEIWADVLGIEEVGINDSFFEIGGDSILSIQVISRAREAGLSFSFKQLFDHPTIAQLAGIAEESESTEAEQGLVKGPVPLTPIQQWFFEQELSEPHHWNQTFLLEVSPDLDLSRLDRSLAVIVRHHDALRLRFFTTESGWKQSNMGEPKSAYLARIDLSEQPVEKQHLAMTRAASDIQAGIDLGEGILLRAAFFDLGIGVQGRILITIHHLGIDAVSSRILLEDLVRVYEQLGSGSTVELPTKTTSFKSWSERLMKYAQSEVLKEEMEFWSRQPLLSETSLPMDFRDGDFMEASAREVSVSLPVSKSEALFKEVPKAYNTQITDVLLTALIQCLAPWTGERILAVGLEGHGREEIFPDTDLSRTVGWLTSFFPVWLDLRGIDEPGPALKSIKEQMRRIPNRGIGYGLLRYCHAGPEVSRVLRGQPQPQVLFNYLGQLDQLSSASWLKLIDGPMGESRSQKGKRSHLLEINAFSSKRRLEFIWTYSNRIHRRETVSALAEDFTERLRILIAHCLNPDVGGFTPSDFPDAGLDQGELDGFIDRIT